MKNEAYFTASYSRSDRDGSHHLYMAFFYSEDGGHSWIARPSVVRTARYREAFDIVSIVSVEDIFVICEENLCASHDGGITLQIIPSNLQLNGKGIYVSGLDFVNPMVGWGFLSLLDGEKALYRTTDGGAAWNLLQPVILLKP
jgi:photosystem II stability/assembly factor-like uncharacterized protein